MPKPKNLFSKLPLGARLGAIVIVIVLIAGAVVTANITGLFGQTTGTGGSSVQTAVVRRGDITLTASGSGTLMPASEATFGFDTSGQVMAVYVKMGDQVEAGQVLAQLDDTLAQMGYAEAQQALQELYSAAARATVQQEIATAQDTEYYAREWLEYLISPEVVAAEEEVAKAETALAEAQAAAKSNPSEAAEQKIKVAQSALTFLQGKLTQAWAYYENEYLPENFTQYERQGRKQVVATYIDPYTGEELPEIDGPSADDIATARNNYVQAQETVKEGETYLEVLSSGVIPEGATGERLKTLYETQLALDNAKLALDATQLVAPISGTVTALDLSVGEQVDTSTVITISQLEQPYILEAYLDETDWSMAQVGNKVEVTFDLLPDQAYPGTVTLVYPELSPSFETSLVHILVQLDNTIPQNLPPGTSVSVDVVGGEARGVVLVPVAALHKMEGGKQIVYVMQNGQQVEREVEIGLQNETYAEVKSGLKAGEVVVTE